MGRYESRHPNFLRLGNFRLPHVYTLCIDVEHGKNVEEMTAEAGNDLGR